MARRRSIYGKKRKINYKRIILLVFILVAIIFLISMFFRKNDYIGVVDDVLKKDIIGISSSISSVSDVDITVYSNKGIRYTNQHEDIKKLNKVDVLSSQYLNQSGYVKILFENLIKSTKTEVVEVLPLKKNGYYWVEADFVVKEQKLFLKDEEEYNFDLYYDIESETVYIKEKYYTEFSTKNNKQKLQGYEATEEFIRLIDELAKK